MKIPQSPAKILLCRRDNMDLTEGLVSLCVFSDWFYIGLKIAGLMMGLTVSKVLPSLSRIKLGLIAATKLQHKF